MDFERPFQLASAWIKEHADTPKEKRNEICAEFIVATKASFPWAGDIDWFYRLRAGFEAAEDAKKVRHKGDPVQDALTSTNLANDELTQEELAPLTELVKTNLLQLMSDIRLAEENKKRNAEIAKSNADTKASNAALQAAHESTLAYIRKLESTLKQHFRERVDSYAESLSWHQKSNLGY
jgi:hypothetical protein